MSIETKIDIKPTNGQINNIGFLFVLFCFIVARRTKAGQSQEWKSLSLSLSVCLSVCLSLSLCLCLSVCLSLSLSLARSLARSLASKVIYYSHISAISVRMLQRVSAKWKDFGVFIFGIFPLFQFLVFYLWYWWRPFLWCYTEGLGACGHLVKKLGDMIASILFLLTLE